MLRLTRTFWRKKPSKRQQAVQSLSTPNVRRPWNDLSHMTAAEKEEVLHGAWRQARPIELRRTAVSAPSDPGAAAAAGAQTTTTTMSTPDSAQPPLVFATDEEAARYLQEEDEDEQQERAFPTLTLAQQFFVDLAQTADEELEEGGGGGGARPQSDEERAEETRDVHRHFFADYYLQQRLLSEADRFAFIDCMTRPGAAVFEVNSERPLARLTVRDQLERQYGHSCFAPSSFSPCAVRLPQTPTQPLGAAPRVPYTAETSPLARQEAMLEEGGGGAQQQQQQLPPQEDLLEDVAADVLADMLQDDVSLVAPLSTVSEVVTEEKQAGGALTQTTAAPLPPPSLDHIYWLQRQVASGSLIVTDPLACLVARLATAAAAAYAGEREGVPPLVLDLTAATGARGNNRSDFSSDIAQYARTHAPLLDVVVVVAAAPPPPHRKGKHEEPLAEDLATAGTTASETAVNLLHVRPSQPRRVWPRFPLAVRQPCAVVLCAPQTTEDGVRPQFLFGDDDPANVVERLPVNQYISVAQTLPERFAHEQRALTRALDVAAQAAHGGADTERAAANPGFVLYCTRSMNPIENEAVVCAVLSQLAQRERYPIAADVVMPAVDLAAAAGEGLPELLAQGLPGLTAWCGVEGGPPEMEAEQYSEALRQRVAAASWRTLPLVHPEDDGAYCVLLRVGPSAPLLPGERPVAEAAPTADEGEAVVVSPPCVVVTDSGVRRVMTAHTARVYEVMRHVRDFQCTVGGVLVGYGAPADKTARCEVSSALSNPAVLRALTEASLVLPPTPCPLPVLLQLLRDGRWSGRLVEEDGWLSALATSLPAASTPQAVLLQPTVCPADLPADQALHPALAEELAAVGVVAEATVDVQRTWLRLRLQVPAGLPDARRQREALREWALGLRDALLYVQRRLGIEETVETAAPETGGSTGEDVRTPGDAPIAWEDGDLEVLPSAPASRSVPPPPPPRPRGSRSPKDAAPVDVFSHEAEMSVAQFMAQLEQERGRVRPQDWSPHAPQRRGGKRW